MTRRARWRQAVGQPPPRRADGARRPSPGRGCPTTAGRRGRRSGGSARPAPDGSAGPARSGRAPPAVHGHRSASYAVQVTWVPWSPSGPKDSRVGTSSAADAGHEDALAGLGGRGDAVGRAARHTAEVAGAGQGDEERPLAEVAPERRAGRGRRRRGRRRAGPGPAPPPGRWPRHDAVAHSARRTEAGRLDTRAIVGVASDAGPRPWP